MARFSQKGNTRFYFVPTIASPALVPTTAEITAGTELTGQLAEVAGFTFRNEPIMTPVMKDSFDAQIPGQDTTEATSLTFWEDKATNPIRTALTKGLNGFIVIFPRGTTGANPATADKAEAWPVTISSIHRRYTAANEAAQYTVDFAMTAPPGAEASLT